MLLPQLILIAVSILAVCGNDHFNCTDLRVCTESFDEPPLIMLALVGFQNDSLKLGITPTIKRLFDCGTQSKDMQSAFMTTTLTDLLTFATGLYPKWSGIIDNEFQDPERKEMYTRDRKTGGWFLREPIWETVQKTGKKFGTTAWVDLEGREKTPDYYMVFNRSITFEERFDQVIEWLNYNDTERPSLIYVHLKEPNMTAHHAAPHSDDTDEAVKKVDRAIKQFVKKLESQGKMGCVNLIIFSYHGKHEMEHNSTDVLEKNEPKQTEHLLSIQRAPNNGTEGALNGVLKSTATYNKTFVSRELKECPESGAIVQTHDKRKCLSLSSKIATSTAETVQCLERTCNSLIWYDETIGRTVLVEGYIDEESWDSARPIFREIGGENTSGCVKISTFMKGMADAPEKSYFTVPKKFAEGTWKYFVELVGAYIYLNKNLFFLAGPIFDSAFDFAPDFNSETMDKDVIPSHIFFVILKCNEESMYDGLCRGIQLSYMLSARENTFSHLGNDKIARMRHIEDLTKMEFFVDRNMDR